MCPVGLAGVIREILWEELVAWLKSFIPFRKKK